jgi:hypothetical protein
LEEDIMKKLVALILAIVMLTGVACGPKKDKAGATTPGKDPKQKEDPNKDLLNE